MKNRNDLISQLQDKGLKITPQRLAIIQVLLENRETHPSAGFIYQEAKKITDHISLSTVYATLKEFSSKGILKSLEFDQMENRYDVNMSEHINLICKRCGAIIDSNLPITINPKEIASKAGFFVTDTRMEYYGYCLECRKKAK